MNGSLPPLPPPLVAFSEGGRSLLVGTCNAALAPDCVRAVGVRIWPDASHLTVLLPKATAATSIANVRENPKLALTLSQVPTHRTMQIKGRVLEIRDGAEPDRELAMRWRTAFALELGYVGQALETTERLGIWPCFAIDVAIEAVFAQTPGPAAGTKLSAETRGLG